MDKVKILMTCNEMLHAAMDGDLDISTLLDMESNENGKFKHLPGYTYLNQTFRGNTALQAAALYNAGVDLYADRATVEEKLITPLKLAICEAIGYRALLESKRMDTEVIEDGKTVAEAKDEFLGHILGALAIAEYNLLQYEGDKK